MQTPNAKRQKVASACNPCRKRKVKCDGIVPVCDKCQGTPEKVAQCTWDHGSRSQSQDKQIKWLEARVQQLEHSRVSVTTDSNHPGIYKDTIEEPSGGIIEHTSVGTIEHHSAQAENTSNSSRTDERLAFSLKDVPVQLGKHTVVPDNVDSQHTPSILGAGNGQNEEQTFYGSSSAGSFLQNVKKLADQTVYNGRQSHLKQVNTSDRANASSVRGQPLITQPHTDYTLPSRRTADRLVAVYWQQMQPIYPFLDELSFQASYETIWTSNGSVINERSLLYVTLFGEVSPRQHEALCCPLQPFGARPQARDFANYLPLRCSLFAIFAIASQLSGPTIIGERERSAAGFATQAKQFWNALDTPSLSLIESYLLLSLYYQSTHEAHTCWLLVGLATRTAQSLGLHHPETSAQALEDSRERMRRLWYGCILMDRTLSMTYGRPYVKQMSSSVLRDSITYRAALWDLLPSVSRPETPADSSAYDFRCEVGPATAIVVPLPNDSGSYCLMLKLHEILHDVLFSFYRTSEKDKAAIEPMANYFDVSSGLTVYAIDRKLNDWVITLPHGLRLDDRAAKDSIQHRQAVILRQRYLHIQILLLRPALSHLLTIEFKQPGATDYSRLSPLFHRILIQCGTACVKAAQEAIALIHTEKAPQPGEVGSVDAWWYNVLFLYSSATCLVAARLTKSVQAEIGDTILESWRKCMAILQEYSTFDASVRRLIATLSILFDTIPKQYGRLEATSATFDLDQNPSALGSDPLFSGSSWQIIQRPTAGVDDFDFGFDPDDLSWLITVPLESSY